MVAPPKDIQEFWDHYVGKAADGSKWRQTMGQHTTPIFHAVLLAHIHPISRGHAESQVSRLKPCI